MPHPTRPDRHEAQERIRTVLAEGWARFESTLPERLAVLEQAAEALGLGPLEPQLGERALRQAHSLAGSLGTFGLPEGTALARQMEQLLRAGPGPTERARLLELVGKVRREIGRGRRNGAVEPRRPAAAFSSIVPQSVLVVDDDETAAELLVAEATSRQMFARAARGSEEARHAIARERPDVVVLDLHLTEGLPEALELLRELAAAKPPIPVLALTASGHLSARVEATRLGVQRFLQKPLAPGQVLDEVSAVHAGQQPAANRVLVVDDDPAILSVVRGLLESYGVKITTLADPMRFWEVFTDVAPDLVVLDVTMPEVSGIDLCRVLRADPSSRSIPILFLTANEEGKTVREAFAAGADDVISKPIVAGELVTRVTGRLRRLQVLRAVSDTDPLTGAANRRRGRDLLQRYLGLARRHGQPMALCLLDLDHFKSVNDRFGHAAGDQVLQRLAELLRSSLRSEDVVARWGGEEFLVGLYPATKEQAAVRLEHALDDLSAEHFFAPDGTTFSVTFSAGVAQFPADGADLSSLYAVADRALYAAKDAGRARVVVAPTRQGG
ncbi:MAG: diguanylate cyclase [Deltaproteobacteria bacterium]|nr:diguanylate cyclase [Deltaproteobacteria bacterium]